MTPGGPSARRTLRRLLATKLRRRRALAKLSFREKIAVVVRMQAIENGIRRAQHRPTRQAWA